ncbi:uncharacterized protein LOC125320066 isoform X3 [Corvus hawaiiensis]|uniref:uncharacterized protein LOC125320066 isoform X3 n=1 Tax=Corvus hawaiiensis TaxID=134902 RepID=UPI0020196F37|nr:uncharacterized protein LOC125320066 isoform X3 [Corvus hawaiiensis]
MLPQRPHGGTQLLSRGQLPLRLRAAVGYSCVTRQRRWLAAHPALCPSLLPPHRSPGARVSRLPSIRGLAAELNGRRAGRLLSAGKLERLIEELQKADPEQGPAMAPSDQGGRLGRCPAAGSSGSGSSGTMRGRWLPWPFALRRGAAGAARAPGQEGSGCSRALFGQPLAAVCAENGTLPRPIQELLAVLQQQGPTTEGIFCKVESARAIQELRQALDRGLPVDMASQPVLLLAVVLKHFLRSIPGKLLVTDLYEDWMAAMQMASREDKISQLKAAMPGRAKWACRQSRQGAPGKKLSSCISLTDRRPPRRWHRDHGSGGPKRQRYVSFTNPSTTRPGQMGRRARRQAGAKGKKDKSQARASEQAGAKAKAQDPKGPQTQKSPKPKSKPPKSPPLKKQVSENLKPKSPPKRQKHRLQNPPNL